MPSCRHADSQGLDEPQTPHLTTGGAETVTADCLPVVCRRLRHQTSRGRQRGTRLGPMPCNVHFVSGSNVTLESEAETVAALLSHGRLERFEQPGKRRDVWINPANVLYVEEAAENPAPVGFSPRDGGGG
jgi:hypothetical protein